MRVNRRDFVRLGTLGTAGVLGLGSTCWPHRHNQAASLHIRIQGLCLVERFLSAATVHLVDGDRLNLDPHVTTLTVPASLVARADGFYFLTDTTQEHEMRVFDLTGMTMKVADSSSGGPDLTFDDGPIPMCVKPDDPACVPAVADDSHWSSLKFAAQLSTLCGSTRIVDTKKFFGSLILERGRLQSAKPADVIGLNYTWTFTRETVGGLDQVIAQQVLTDTLMWTGPSTLAGTTFTFADDARTIVLKPGFPAVVTLKNLPSLNTRGKCKGVEPCLDHLEALYDLVDAQFRPKVTHFRVISGDPNIRPNYCPPAI